MEETKIERKTKTSTAAKKRYNAKTYSRLTVILKKDQAEIFKKKCEEHGVAQNEIVRNAILKYLGEDE